jgi:hypothetical protein
MGKKKKEKPEKPLKYCKSCHTNIVIGRKQICNTCQEKKRNPTKYCKDCHTTIIAGRKQICDACQEKRKLRICTLCKKSFIPVDKGQYCQICKEETYRVLGITSLLIVKNHKLFYPNIEDINYKIPILSTFFRNNFKEATRFCNFKVAGIGFEKVIESDSTWDHNNSMKFCTQKIFEYILTDPGQNSEKLKYIQDFILKYGYQFRTSQKINNNMILDQQSGMTARKYIEHNGRIIKDGILLSEEESIELLNPYFIVKE